MEDEIIYQDRYDAKNLDERCKQQRNKTTFDNVNFQRDTKI